MSVEPLEIEDGHQVEIGTAESLVVRFLWGLRNLPETTTIGSSTMTAAKVTPTAGSAVLTVDSDSVLSDGRTTQVRVVAGGSGARGHLYRITNTIVTTESPAQTKARFFLVRVK